MKLSNFIISNLSNLRMNYLQKKVEIILLKKGRDWFGGKKESFKTKILFPKIFFPASIGCVLNF